jgi:hypothetical protein
MSTRGREGVPVRRERFSGVMCTPEGDEILSSEKRRPACEGESRMRVLVPDRDGRLRG